MSSSDPQHASRLRAVARLMGCAALAAGCVLAPGWAVADEPGGACPGDDEVSLKNGGMLRGAVMAVEPGKQVVIVVCGDKRVLPWAEVHEVSRGKGEPAPDAGAPETTDGGEQTPAEEAGPAAMGGLGTSSAEARPGAGGLVGVLGALAAPAAPPPPQPGVVRIHIDSDDPDVRLYRYGTPAVAQVGNAVSMVPTTGLVCQSPCDTIVDGRKGAQLYFSGDGVPMSDTFEIGERSGDLVAQVDAGIGGLHLVGGLVGGFGGVALLLGAIFTPAGLATTDAGRPQSTFTTVGEGMLAGGSAGLLAGILMMAASGTDFELVAPDGTASDARGGLVPVWRF